MAAMSSIWTVRRSATDAKLAGLAGGMAEHWGIDPVLVRVAWVLLALSGGVGLVLYLAGWLLIPLEGRSSAPVDDLLGDAAGRWSKEVWLTLVVVACLAAFAVFGTVSPFGVGPAVIIACVWYFGFYKQRQGQETAGEQPTPQVAPALDAVTAVPLFVSHAGPATPFTDAADAWRRRIEEHVQQASGGAVAPAAVASWPTPPVGPAPAALQDPDPEERAHSAFLAEPDPVGLYVEQPVAARVLPAPPRPAGERPSARRLRLLTLLVLGLSSGGLALADRLGADIAPAGYAATALLVVGLALVAATWFGRARGLLPLGLLLVPVVVLTSVAGPLAHLDQWDSQSHTYTKLAELPPGGDTLVAGDLRVDLTRLDVPTSATYAAHVGTGQLEVVVPADVNVVLHYKVDHGVVEAYGQEPRGGSHLTEAPPPTNALAGRPTLTLDLSVDRGHLAVRQ
jgi:phage shock protein PspC (stress-responsive transcriptional regulator)